LATGASTANLAIILIDARYGVLQQSRRHAFLAALLGIPHLIVAVNKMDLMEFREDVFTAICQEFRAFAAQIDAGDIVYIPISALDGDNVVHPSRRTPWYDGPTLLEHLETVPIARDLNLTDLRFPVQYVIRPNLDFRGFAGTLASGVVHPGDAITVLPGGRTSRVKSIVTWDGELGGSLRPHVRHPLPGGRDRCLSRRHAGPPRQPPPRRPPLRRHRGVDESEAARA
jgi:sulfate adenylyltransferase subunit 1 (EFTu-like GTPase family)